MAFAGVVTTANEGDMKPQNGFLARWHSLFENEDAFFELRANALDKDWRDVIDGKRMPPTEDVGSFRLDDAEENIWVEKDPENTLCEVWQRISTGDGRYLAVLKKDRTVLLVVCGAAWGCVVDPRAKRGPTSTDEPSRIFYAVGQFASGKCLVHDVLSPKDVARIPVLDDDGQLALPGRGPADYDRLPGSSISWPPRADTKLQSALPISFSSS